MNYNEMTAQQCADWLAAKYGWHYEPTQIDGMGETREYWWKWTISSTHGGRTYAYKPPFALTLDAAAGALREPWKTSQINIHPSGYTQIQLWNVPKDATSIDFGDTVFLRQSGPDELTARYRAAVAARMEEET